MQRIEGKVCVITGAALGIGRACAVRMGEEGARPHRLRFKALK